MRYFGLNPRSRKESSKAGWLIRANDKDDCIVSLTNETSIPLQLYLDDQGPVFTVGAGKRELRKELPPMQLQGVRSWAAVATINGYSLTVHKGRLSDEMRKRCLIHVPRSVFNEAILGMSPGAYLRLVNAQQMWRRHFQSLAAARALRKRRAAQRIAREVLAHLHRSPRTCFVCFDTVRWDAMVTLVPEAKCHRVCRGCASRHIDVALTEGRMHVRCAGEGCTHQIGKATLRQYGSPEALSQWRQNQRAANARRASSLTSEDGAFLAFCSEHARICPGCHVIIYRHAGCDHMTCMCGFEFNWTMANDAKIRPDGRLVADGGTEAMPTDDSEPRARGPARRLRAPIRLLAPRTAADEEAQLAAAIAESLAIHGRDGELVEA